jgi:ABC-type multidrug transport system permease subunit
MAKLHSFVSTYSPILAVGAAIIGLYAMAICIGCGLSLPV